MILNRTPAGRQPVHEVAESGHSGRSLPHPTLTPLRYGDCRQKQSAPPAMVPNREPLPRAAQALPFRRMRGGSGRRRSNPVTKSGPDRSAGGGRHPLGGLKISLKILVKALAQRILRDFRQFCRQRPASFKTGRSSLASAGRQTVLISPPGTLQPPIPTL